MRLEDTFRLLIANLLTRRESLVIQMNPVGRVPDGSNVIDLRSDSHFVRAL